MYFEALASGGGDDWYNVILLTATNGITVTVSDGDEEIEIVGTGLQQAVTIHNENATYTISANMNGLTKSAASITTDSTSGKLFIRELKMAAIEVTFDDDFRGLDYTISDGTTTSTTQTFPATGNTVDIFVPNTGVWKVTSTVGSDTFESQGANVTSLDSSYTDSIHVIPDGKTVTPVNDIQIWLACANIKNKPYTKLEEVLADENTLRRLLTDNNAIDYLKRSTEWINKGLVPVMTSNTAPSGIASDSQGTANAYKAFDGDDTTVASLSSDLADAYVQYKFTQPTKVSEILCRTEAFTGVNSAGINIFYSDDGTNFTLSDTYTMASSEFDTDKIYEVSETGSHEYWRVSRVLSSAKGGLFKTIQFYPVSEGIPENELAMSYIGAYDYAADTLLSDADWTEGICNSEYMNLVLNSTIPKMTDYNAPSGLVTKSSEYGANYKAWHIFDRDTSTTWASSSGSSGWVAYDFGSTSAGKKFINACIRFAGSSSNLYKFKIQGSDDNFVSDINDLCSEQSVAPSATEGYNVLLNTSKSYRCYRLWQTSTNAYDVTELELRGREAAGIQTLLKLAGIERPYTTTDELFDDDEALAAVISSHADIDYLVTAKSFIDAFTSNAKAMRYIGKRNYAANTLLADDDWAKGICGSEYFESVLNNHVPKMTSATTPEGQAFADSEYSPAWRAFDGDTENGWTSLKYSSSGVNTDMYLGYMFDTPKCCILFDVLFSNVVITTSFRIEASNTGNWDTDKVELTPVITVSGKNENNYILTNNQTAYKYYRVYITTQSMTGGSSYYAGQIQEARFLGRSDVDETILDIYSAASDSNIHLMQGGSPVNVGSTDTTGHGTISRSVLPNGEYELYSSVAKDPDNLSNDYHKTVKITDDTIEINLMPENAFYWYGYGDSNLEDATTANGWSQYASGYPLSAPTHNTQNINLNAGSNIVGVALKDSKSDIDRLNFLIDPTFTGSNADSKYILQIIGNKSYSNQDYQIIEPSVGTSGHEILKNRYDGGRIPLIAGLLVSNAKLFGMWNTKHNPLANFFSAAKDTVYYTQGGIDIVVAETNELGEALVDLSSIPSGVILKSSVAKDPDNLSNDYTKIFTMPLTEKFYFMPDNALYWYGYMSNDCEECTTENGWELESGYTESHPIYGINDAQITNSVGTGNCGLSSKKKVSGNCKAIAQGVTVASGYYGYYYLRDSKTFRSYYQIGNITNDNLAVYGFDNVVDKYFSIALGYTRNTKVYAMWYE